MFAKSLVENLLNSSLIGYQKTFSLNEFNGINRLLCSNLFYVEDCKVFR
jgi:hypothetical protein